MRAIALVPGTTKIHLVERPAPRITQADEVRLKVLAVGICGTDREEARGGRAKAPAGARELVLGHEMLGRVVECGADVHGLAPGDLAVATVRRGCGRCMPCRMGRADMCRTGDYTERGIWGRDGFDAEEVVERAENVVRLAPEVGLAGVLTEPLSVAEKALDVAARVQRASVPDAPAHADWWHGRRCLVAGLGPVGLLAALALRLRGAEVWGLDVVDAGSARPRWLEHVGGRYVDGRTVHADEIDDKVGAMDVIVEAAGVAALEFRLIDALALDGVYVLTGIPGGDASVDLRAADLSRALVLGNRAVIGSVNEAHGHVQLAADDLARARRTWGAHLDALITHRFKPEQYEAALTTHPAGAIKAVIEWAA